jgi:hypothetical protein
MRKRGPEPDSLKIEGEWEDAVKRALQKKHPASGWPKPPKKQPKNK